jgi:hypothetical protein
VIFEGLLPNSATPTEDLADLRLERSDAVFIRTSAYFPNGGFQNVAFTERFVTHVQPRILAKFYLRHPSRAFMLLISNLDDAGNIRPVNGNFDPVKDSHDPFRAARSLHGANLRGPSC